MKKRDVNYWEKVITRVRFAVYGHSITVAPKTNPTIQISEDSRGQREKYEAAKLP